MSTFFFTIIVLVATIRANTMDCPVSETCIIDCNDGCINITINASLSSYLTINNCNVNSCTNLIIYLPITIDKPNVTTNLANFNGINGEMKNSIIYTINGFLDFTVSNLSMLNTSIFCGNNQHIHSCIASTDCTSCSPSSFDQTCNTVTNAIAVTESILTDSESATSSTSTSSIPHHHINIFGMVICSLLAICILLMCVIWLRHELNHRKLRKAQRAKYLSDPLLFTEPHSATFEPKSFGSNEFTSTESIFSLNAATSNESADTFRTRITNSILEIALTQSAPIGDHDNHNYNEDEHEHEHEPELGANLLYHAINDSKQLVLENIMARPTRSIDYPVANEIKATYTQDTMYGDGEFAMDDESEESDLLGSTFELNKKSTLSGSRVSVDNKGIGADTPDEEFIVTDDM